jgi:hypothetical protein
MPLAIYLLVKAGIGSCDRMNTLHCRSGHKLYFPSHRSEDDMRN